MGCWSRVTRINGRQKPRFCSSPPHGATIWKRPFAPAVAAGQIVICDRFADSTRVYQGSVRAPKRALVDDLHSLIIKDEPDVTFVIDMDADVAAGRAASRDDSEGRFESFGVEFQQKLRAGFCGTGERTCASRAVLCYQRGSRARGGFGGGFGGFK